MTAAVGPACYHIWVNDGPHRIVRTEQGFSYRSLASGCLYRWIRAGEAAAGRVYQQPSDGCSAECRGLPRKKPLYPPGAEILYNWYDAEDML